MARAVFTTKVNPTYDDLPEQRYHFPHTYLSRIRQAVGDWIVYYEPRRPGSDPAGRTGRQAYFATARVVRIEPDDRLPKHYYALVTDYVDFPRAVPFREGSAHYYEAAIRMPDGSTSSGAFRNAVRLLSDDEYDGILAAGLATVLHTDVGVTGVASGFGETADVFARPLVERLVHRPLRDAAFAQTIGRAYDFTCAVTGMRILNGGGRPEVEAAHIRPVGDGHAGPDSIRNGLALSRTAHWMFDRGLLSLSDKYRILVSDQYIPDPMKSLLRPDGQVILPANPLHQPHPTFLRYHRERIFKG